MFSYPLSFHQFARTVRALAASSSRPLLSNGNLPPVHDRERELLIQHCDALFGFVDSYDELTSHEDFAKVVIGLRKEYRQVKNAPAVSPFDGVTINEENLTLSRDERVVELTTSLEWRLLKLLWNGGVTGCSDKTIRAELYGTQHTEQGLYKLKDRVNKKLKQLKIEILSDNGHWHLHVNDLVPETQILVIGGVQRAASSGSAPDSRKRVGKKKRK